MNTHCIKKNLFWLLLFFCFFLFISCSPLNSDLTKHDTKNLLTIHTIDVSQGDSTLIVSPAGKKILIDAGNNSFGEDVVHYIKQQGIHKIDILIGTHPDADHIGGIDSVIENFEIDKFYMPIRKHSTKTYRDVIQAAKKKNLTIEDGLAGMEIPFEEDISVTLLSPFNHAYTNNNQFSIVTYITYNRLSFLFMGDADEYNEQEILSHYPNLKCNFLKIGHHGSKHSTSEQFLTSVSPNVISISCGYKNQFHHPNKRVMELIQKYNIPVYRTDEQKTIRFFSDGIHLSTDMPNPASYDYPTE